ncbi:hypothetical protein SH2C18_15400 [Clostridium sediminicola]|uniref:hypothetical protein n=1 Tax=Clostridium sediminicola TaxID=3114879 RepID=UPI0031F210BB
MYCDEGKNNLCKFPVLIIVILLLLFCKDKEGFRDCFKEDECKPDYCRIKPVKKHFEDDEDEDEDDEDDYDDCESCEPCGTCKICEICDPCEPCKPCKPCKSYEKVYDTEEDYGSCIEDMAYYDSCDEYCSNKYKECNHKKVPHKVVHKEAHKVAHKVAHKEKELNNFIDGLSLDDLDIDEKTIEQANQLMKQFLK